MKHEIYKTDDNLTLGMPGDMRRIGIFKVENKGFQADKVIGISVENIVEYDDDGEIETDEDFATFYLRDDEIDEVINFLKKLREK